MLVEDSEIIAAGLSERLRKAGYRVEVRKNSREVISFVEINKPDLILMDIELAGSRLNGIETMKTLRRKYTIPALYLTALDEDKFFEQAKETDPFAYISKSCDWLTLKNQIEMALYRDKIESEKRRLAEERNLLLSILETNIDEIYLFDFKTLKIQYANRGAAKKLGMTGADLLEKTITDVNPELDATSALEKMQEIIRGGERALMFEGRHRRADGETYPVECRLRLIERGRTYSMLLVAFDVTDKANHAKRLYEEERHRFAEELAAHKERAETACHAKKIFFENISHDFRTPLNAVMGYSEILKQKIGGTDQEIDSYLEGIINGGSKLLELVDGIIDLSCSTGAANTFNKVKAPDPNAGRSIINSSATVYKFEAANALIVDDSELNRKIVSAMLLKVGLNPIAAASGEEAIAKSEAAPPSIIILDMNMPGMSGLDTARALKSSPALAKIPVVALSGLRIGEQLEAMTKIADGYLVKPVTLESLSVELAKFLKHTKSTRHARPQAELSEAPAKEREAIRERFGERARELTEGLSLDKAMALAIELGEFGREIKSRSAENFAERLMRAIEFYNVGEALKALGIVAAL